MASCSSSVQTGLPRAGEREMAEKITRWVDENVLPFKPFWNRRNAHAEPVQCGIYRPDFVFEEDAGVVIDEYDEHCHQQYKLRCELIRQGQVSLGYGGRPVHWIRYNPDHFSIDNQTNLGIQTRDDVHLKQLQLAILNPDYDYFIKIDYLFYNPMFGGEGGMIQSFKFRTIQDYEEWVAIVAPDDQTTQCNGAKGMSSCKKVLVSYGSSGESITHTMLSIYPAIIVDECYTLSQRDLKYTLIHSQVRVSRWTICNILKDLDKKYGIKSVAVFGYDEISIGDSIESHPGLRLMIDHIASKSPLFEYWMQNGSLGTNTRGILYKYLPLNLVEKVTKSQLAIKKSQLAQENEILKKENKSLRAELEAAELQMNELQSENKRLRSRVRMFEAVTRPLPKTTTNQITSESAPQQAMLGDSA